MASAGATLAAARAGISAEERLELKRLYHKLFRSGENLSQAVLQARSEFTGPSAYAMIDFIAASKRGVLRHHGRAED